jgi:RNA polymerase sigma-70 factor (ECF subfamily)
MCRIYGKYKDYLITIAGAILYEKTVAEDVVHDVFVSFAESIGKFKLTGSLKGYLARCVANRARDRMRALRQRDKTLDSADAMVSSLYRPEQYLAEKEELVELRLAISKLPEEQREVVVLYLKGGLKFKEIAVMQDVSISTVHSRYQYALKKLRLHFNSEVTR